MKSNKISVEPLTKKQKDLINEVKQINSLLGLDYENSLRFGKPNLTVYLEMAKQQIIRGQIITWYTWIDELLSMRICHYFFGKKKSFIYLWRTKKFQNFNHHVLEELVLLPKLRFVKSITKVPKNISKDIEAINYLRNGLAHSFFPDNLKKSKPVYKGKHIFTYEGLEILKNDFNSIFNYFMKIL